jgi:addiction module RelB/DinJ family antitoxin
MTTININLDKEIIEKANEILNAVGLNMDIALQIFINNIIVTKGFPIDLKQKDIVQNPETNNKRKIIKINEEMIQAVWDKFKILSSGKSNVIELSDAIETEVRMSKGSAFIYLTILMNMIQGQKNTRNMKVKDFQFFLNKINKEMGQSIFLKSLQSLNDSIPYWEEKNLHFATSIRDLVDSYQ